MTSSPSGLKIKVTGIVQGVGFRPFIYNLARSLALTGWVSNTSSGVVIAVEGQSEELDRFLQSIRSAPPPMAKIDSVEVTPAAINGYAQFEILASQSAPGDFIPVSPDIAICADCRRELFTPSDRRFRYPFINCTNCGPRFSIIRDIPYDRPLTSMAAFDLCPDCEREYHDPADRRFHAQPVACPVCGPQVRFVVAGEQLSQGEDAIQTARSWLQAGKILAVKGLGGYHLACDATNPTVVAELRRRKKRSDKPFAVMAYDVPAARNYCLISPAEQDLLSSSQAPVVLLACLPGTPAALAQIAPGQNRLGIMLAYTPLHLLLCEPGEGFPGLLVMTSGNLSEEPIAYEDADALERLSPLADAFLLHDRPIQIRVDDSVVISLSDQPYFHRRSRGYAPDPLRLPHPCPPILAAGAELKNTFCLTRERYAFLSHHIGDLENLETLLSFEEGIRHYERLFRVIPEAIACDLHPNYLSTRYAQERAGREQLPLIAVQHHHAHLAACLADNDWDSPEAVIGLCFDGTGYGEDGAIWGGEVMLGNYAGFERRSHLAYTHLVGGDQAVRKPARMALAFLRQSELEWEADLPPVQALCAEERTVIASQIQHNLNAPFTSSMGRLFDAVSALIGLRQVATYEGQAAIELEAAADPNETGAYAFDLTADQFSASPILQAILSDWRAGTPIPILAARFHNSVAQLCLELSTQIRTATGCQTVALSGGVWQNRLLLTRSQRLLQNAGFKVLIHHNVPTNDGGIALGQALIAAHHLARV